MRILILEDTEERIHKFKQKLQGNLVKITDKPKECIEWLRNDGPWDYIFLDHDMGPVFSQPGEGTGWEVAKWIADNPQYCPTRVFLHTMNNVGAAAMMRTLGDANLRATYIPLLWEKLVVDNEAQKIKRQ